MLILCRFNTLSFHLKFTTCVDFNQLNSHRFAFWMGNDSAAACNPVINYSRSLLSLPWYRSGKRMNRRIMLCKSCSHCWAPVPLQLCLPFVEYEKVIHGKFAFKLFFTLLAPSLYVTALHWTDCRCAALNVLCTTKHCASALGFGWELDIELTEPL